MAFELQHDQRFHQPKTAGDLLQLIQNIRQSNPEAAFWLVDDDQPSLCLLTSGDKACLCHEPTLSWSKSEGNAGDDDTVPFRLENGQVDEIPADCVIHVDTAMQVFCEFYETGELSDRITWH